MAELINEVSFSPSRESMLKSCARKYFYGVYLMWNGWYRKGFRTDPRRAAAYTAKHITTEPMLIGTIVHDVAQWALTQARNDSGFLVKYGGHSGLREHLLRISERKVSEAVSQANSEIHGSPKTWTQLLSVLTGGQADEDFLRSRVRSKIEALVSPDQYWNNGVKVNANLFMRTVTNPSCIIHVEELIQWRINTGRYVIPAFVKHDLVVKNGRDPNACVIIDWKTGKVSSSGDDQLDFYAAWASSAGWEKVSTALVYLEERRGESMTEVKWSSPGLNESTDRAKARVNSFVDNLASRLVDGDVTRNEPIEDRFEPTINRNECRSCVFQKLCERDGTKPK